MSWELRNGKYFYYRKRRIGKQVISEYVGSGPAGHLQAQIVEARKRQQANSRAKFRALSEPTAIDLEIEKTIALLNSLVVGFLLIEGHHQHKRGDWRKRRNA